MDLFQNRVGCRSDVPGKTSSRAKGLHGTSKARAGLEIRGDEVGGELASKRKRDMCKDLEVGRRWRAGAPFPDRLSAQRKSPGLGE